MSTNHLASLVLVRAEGLEPGRHAAKDPGLRSSTYAFMHIYDLAIMIPFGFLSLLTGVFLSAGTNWGLFSGSRGGWSSYTDLGEVAESPPICEEQNHAIQR